MGLDSFVSRSPGDVVLTDEDKAAFAQADIELCGGMFSGDEGASFRGKVYLDVVDRVSGATLFQEWIPPEEIRRMWEAFDRADEDGVVEASKDDHYPVTIEEFENLRELLRICVERDLGLIGWW